ncbi:hypothetical protein TURU_122281 [Turdus rufiventris]|nr:hypothetical protein TURU_122281 [Turdus rufiventris]
MFGQLLASTSHHPNSRSQVLCCETLHCRLALSLSPLGTQPSATLQRGINFQEEQLDSTESQVKKAEMENHHYGDGSELSYVSFSMYLVLEWV